MEHVHRGVKEIHVTADIFKSISEYIDDFDKAGITQNDLVQLNESTLVVHTYRVKKALNGVGLIKFIEGKKEAHE